MTTPIESEPQREAGAYRQIPDPVTLRWLIGFLWHCPLSVPATILSLATICVGAGVALEQARHPPQLQQAAALPVTSAPQEPHRQTVTQQIDTLGRDATMVGIAPADRPQPEGRKAPDVNQTARVVNGTVVGVQQ